jgi:anti-anti-sigma factor
VYQVGNLDVATTTVGPRTILAVKGDLDISTHVDFENAVALAWASGEGDLVLDVSGLDFADSCGLRSLITVGRLTAGRVVLRGVQPLLAGLLELSGTDGMFTWEEPAQEAG